MWPFLVIFLLPIAWCLLPVPRSLVGAGCPWRSMIAATERVCSLFPVPYSLTYDSFSRK